MYEIADTRSGVVYAAGTLPAMWREAEGCGGLTLWCGSRVVLRNCGSLHARREHTQQARRVRQRQVLAMMARLDAELVSA